MVDILKSFKTCYRITGLIGGWAVFRARGRGPGMVLRGVENFRTQKDYLFILFLYRKLLHECSLVSLCDLFFFAYLPF